MLPFYTMTLPYSITFFPAKRLSVDLRFMLVYRSGNEISTGVGKRLMMDDGKRNTIIHQSLSGR